MIYITHDTHHKLDYAFIGDDTDELTSVDVYQDVGATIIVVSCSVNSAEMEDSEGNTYPAGKAIIMWIEGGTPDTIESLRLVYNTRAGRRFDEKVVFRIVDEE